MTRRFFSGLFLTTSQILWAGKVATSTQEALPSPGTPLAPPPSDLYLADDRFMKLLEYLKGRYLSYGPMSLHGDLTCIISEFMAETHRETIDVASLEDQHHSQVSGLTKATLNLKLGPTAQDPPLVDLDILLLPGFTFATVPNDTRPGKSLQTLVAKDNRNAYYLDHWQGYITSLEFLR